MWAAEKDLVDRKAYLAEAGGEKMNKEILSKIEDIFGLADKVQEKAFQIFYSSGHVFDTEYYDTSAIDCDSSLQTHKRKAYFKIIEKVNQEIDKKGISDLLDIRKEALEHSLETLSRNNIGTHLNKLRELYNDVLNDILRHS